LGTCYQYAAVSRLHAGRSTFLSFAICSSMLRVLRPGKSDNLIVMQARRMVAATRPSARKDRVAILIFIRSNKLLFQVSVKKPLQGRKRKKKRAKKSHKVRGCHEIFLLLISTWENTFIHRLVVNSRRRAYHWSLYIIFISLDSE
jgi:hypothetical protein